jgi:hypothetical protein
MTRDDFFLYIARKPQLLCQMIFVWEMAKQYFAKEHPYFSFEIKDDPECDNRETVLYIRLQEYPDSFLDKIDDFRHFISQCFEDLNNFLWITTDFQKP